MVRSFVPLVEQNFLRCGDLRNTERTATTQQVIPLPKESKQGLEEYGSFE